MPPEASQRQPEALRSSSRPEASRRPQLVPGVFPPPDFFLFFLFFLITGGFCEGGGAMSGKTRVLEGGAHPPPPKPEIYRLLPPRVPPGVPPGAFLLKSAAVIKKHVLAGGGDKR